MRRSYRVIVPSFVVVSLGLLACRTEEDGSGGAGGSSSATMSTGTKGTTSSTMSTSGSNMNTTSSGTGGAIGCNGDEHTISDITTNVVGKGIKVTLKGVVAMSQIFSVSAGDTSCLWGVFVSDPGLAETKENSGILALSYGSPPAIPPGGKDAFCPGAGKEPLGTAFPDDLQPGDVFDLVGVADAFPNTFNCTGANPANMVGQKQLSQICKATKTGTAPVPAPHVVTAAELALLGSTTDKAFHDKWGGVKVRIEDPTMTAIDEYGMTLDGALNVSRKAWYRPISDNKQCHGKDLAYMTNQVFDHVDGFHYLNFCTWGIAPSDRCGDFSPTSMACTTAGTTTCGAVP